MERENIKKGNSYRCKPIEYKTFVIGRVSAIYDKTVVVLVECCDSIDYLTDHEKQHTAIVKFNDCFPIESMNEKNLSGTE